MSGRSLHAKAILGQELYGRLSHTKVLLVGAGGIGCELLKNIVLTGFGDITLLDLDTIDLSNLNRQFLFRKKDVKQSKAMVASRTASAFNPNVKITPIHANIKEPQFDVAWFRGFDIVLNALDNLDARRHVNKMCMAANVPLVESGTAGYLGQVQPILKDRAECFDCIPKPTPKTFPVCTIRSTPSQPIHCIVWAKSYLIPQLFGEDEDADAGGELDEAEKQGENSAEIATLRKEAQAFKSVRAALRSTSADASSSSSAAKQAFDKVFHSDVLNLLSMGDMWRSRAPPTPLDFDAIRAGTFVLARKSKNGAVAPQTNGTTGSSVAEKQLNGGSTSASVSAEANGAKLKDQRALTLQDNLELFVASAERLAVRLRAGEETISFDKDDEDTLDFVTAAANLRSAAYGIPGKSRWEVKEMAGNIIPAIATTNAIIAGLIVLQALHLLRRSYSALRNVHVQFKPSMPLSAITMCAPSPSCGVCRDTYAEVRCDPARVTLRQVVDGVLGRGAAGAGSASGGGEGEDGSGADGEGERDGPAEVSVYEDKRVLSDPDWDDNDGRTLESLNVTRGKFLSIVDEDGEFATIQVAIGALPPNHPLDGPALILPSPLPAPPRREKPRPATPPPAPPPALAGKKRSAPDDDIQELDAPSAKRSRTDAGTASGALPFTPSKKRRLEEDGLIMLENEGEKIEEDRDPDVIEID
ncbi:Ubiquitin-activating enzyme E1-like [Trametes pubescens]|uniref:Ubiquitin-activating enzyme E1-like n=1 Tax=Trametes pubescens TaxID=154538 RepID=A0A1M2W4M6_TRAPU|nr:Ubiquitin-activating enzyme E1-like [Trametes pubescens]